MWRLQKLLLSDQPGAECPNTQAIAIAHGVCPKTECCVITAALVRSNALPVQYKASGFLSDPAPSRIGHRTETSQPNKNTYALYFQDSISRLIQYLICLPRQ